MKIILDYFEKNNQVWILVNIPRENYLTHKQELDSWAEINAITTSVENGSTDKMIIVSDVDSNRLIGEIYDILDKEIEMKHPNEQTVDIQIKSILQQVRQHTWLERLTAEIKKFFNI